MNPTEEAGRLEQEAIRKRAMEGWDRLQSADDYSGAVTDLDVIRECIEKQAIEIERLRAQPSHQQQPDGWRTIESAPKDETYVLADWSLVLDGDYDPTVVHWNGASWVDSYGKEYSVPDFWQPLPAPPLLRTPQVAEADEGEG